MEADEQFTHQIVDTFASVAQSDPSWTEKVWAIAHARDGSLQVVFGLGKYTNRGVYDSAGGVCRGTDQWTVRGSRILSSDPNRSSVGPLHYEVVEPLKAVRCQLEPNEHAEIAFDIVWRGTFEPSLEIPWPSRSPDGYRITHNCQRYHQLGVAEGWVEVEGRRTEVAPDSWISIRDHSWGLRPGIGLPIPGLPRGKRAHQTLLTWFPMLMERPDGSHYSLFAFRQHGSGEGWSSTESQAEEHLPSGELHRFASVEQDLRFVDKNRRLIGGTVTLIDTDGSTRPLTIKPVSETGFHLGTGGYFGWKGRPLGHYAGPLHIDGEKIERLDSPDVAHEVHQLRDLLVTVDDPVGGGAGLGNIETLAAGDFPELGLTAEKSFM